MPRPGFEPGSWNRKPQMLGRTTLPGRWSIELEDVVIKIVQLTQAFPFSWAHLAEADSGFKVEVFSSLRSSNFLGAERIALAALRSFLL